LSTLTKPTLNLENLSRDHLLELTKEAQQLDRIEAKNSFLDFCIVQEIEPYPAAHHKLIIDKLEQFGLGLLPRLMIFTPPGYAKSTYASILFPPYYLAKNKRKKIVTGSYNTDLSDYFGKIWSVQF